MIVESKQYTLHVIPCMVFPFFRDPTSTRPCFLHAISILVFRVLVREEPYGGDFGAVVDVDST